MDFIINEQTANKILNYLASKPFGEVHELIKELQTIKPLTQPQNIAEVKKDQQA